MKKITSPQRKTSPKKETPKDVLLQEKPERITREMIINDVVKKYPQTITVFNAYRVDSCCGGGQSIEKTATADGVDVGALLTALNQAVWGT